MLMLAIKFAVTLIVLIVAHHVADHWVQTNAQAVAKDERSRTGQWADLRHVTTYTATLAAALLVTAWRLHLSYDPVRFAIALTGNALTHYWADRRIYLEAIARRIGKGGWLDDEPTAAYLLDQSWHTGWLWVTALVMV